MERLVSTRNTGFHRIVLASARLFLADANPAASVVADSILRSLTAISDLMTEPPAAPAVSLPAGIAITATETPASPPAGARTDAYPALRSWLQALLSPGGGAARHAPLPTDTPGLLRDARLCSPTQSLLHTRQTRPLAPPTPSGTSSAPRERPKAGRLLPAPTAPSPVKVAWDFWRLCASRLRPPSRRRCRLACVPSRRR